MIKTESFIDQYIPIQIHNGICEALKKTMQKGAMSRIEIYELEKLQVLNNNVLNEEKH